VRRRARVHDASHIMRGTKAVSLREYEGTRRRRLLGNRLMHRTDTRCSAARGRCARQKGAPPAWCARPVHAGRRHHAVHPQQATHHLLQVQVRRSAADASRRPRRPRGEADTVVRVMYDVREGATGRGGREEAGTRVVWSARGAGVREEEATCERRSKRRWLGCGHDHGTSAARQALSARSPHCTASSHNRLLTSSAAS